MSKADCVAPSWKLDVVIGHTRWVAHHQGPPQAIPRRGRPEAGEGVRRQEGSALKGLLGGAGRRLPPPRGLLHFPEFSAAPKIRSLRGTGRLAAWDW